MFLLNLFEIICNLLDTVFFVAFQVYYVHFDTVRIY